jgi:hypothetical protein
MGEVVDRLFPRISCLGGVRESIGVQTKSGSAEPGARDFLFRGVQFRLGVYTPQWGPWKITGCRLVKFLFPVFCSASAQPTPSARVPCIINQSTRFRPRMCLWGSQRSVSSNGGITPIIPRDVNGDFQMKLLLTYLGTCYDEGCKLLIVGI